MTFPGEKHRQPCAVCQEWRAPGVCLPGRTGYYWYVCQHCVTAGQRSAADRKEEATGVQAPVLYPPLWKVKSVWWYTCLLAAMGALYLAGVR